MRPVLFAASAAAALLTASAVAAQPADGDLAIGGQIGTPGLGATVQYQASETLVLRGTVDVLQYDDEFSTDDIDYDGELDWVQGGAFIDYHPGASPLFVSGGVYFGGREVDVDATSSVAAEIGDVTFTAAEIGTLEGRADFGDVAPFVGVGWDNTFYTANRWGFRALLGAAIGQDPEVTLRRTGGVTLPAATQTSLDAELRREEAELEDDAEDLRVFPVLQLGLTYRF